MLNEPHMYKGGHLVNLAIVSPQCLSGYNVFLHLWLDVRLERQIC